MHLHFLCAVHGRKDVFDKGLEFPLVAARNVDGLFVTFPHGFVISVELDGKHGDVVELRSLLYKIVYFLFYKGAGGGGTNVATFFYCFDQPVVAKQFLLAICGLGYAVGVKEQGVSLLEVKGLLLVHNVFHGGHDQFGFAVDKFHGTVLVADGGWVVACRCEFHVPGLQVDYSAPDGHEHI